MPAARMPAWMLPVVALVALVAVGLALFTAGVFDGKKDDPSTPIRPSQPGSNPTPPPDNGKGPDTPPQPPAKLTAILKGGGSTFVNPMMQHWGGVYLKEVGVQIDYKGGGSSAGVEGVLNRFLDFGCSDAPLTPQQIEKGKKIGGEVLHIPLVQGAVVPIYKLPMVKEQLRFTGPVLAKIYLGQITRWNDPAIKISNPDAAADLPDLPIIPVCRQDGSGTTFIWTDYLSKVEIEFATQIGKNNLPKWPTKSEGKDQVPIVRPAEKRGNDGVAEEVNRNVGAIGYVELTFALEKSIPFGQVKNHDGKWIEPSLESVTAAAANSPEVAMAENFIYSLTDAPGALSYPISGTAWAMIYVNPQDTKQARETIKFLRWCLHDGQKETRKLGYAALPADLIKRVTAALDKLPAAK